MTDRTVTICIPVYRPVPSAREDISLKRCLEVLGTHPLVFVGPSSLDYTPYLGRIPGASVERFPDHHFASVRSYSELMLSTAFYERFSTHEHVLIHQTDVFVFRDDLLSWCERGFDYVGGPWWSEKRGWIGAGNGGFSLRRPARCLEVLRSRHKETAATYWDHVQRMVFPRAKRLLHLPRVLARRLGLMSTVDHHLRRFLRKGENEDLFWAFVAPRYLPGFRVAPVEGALEFSLAETGFEVALAHYHARQRPPFGCHHRVRYLRWVERFLSTDQPPQSEAEQLFRELVELSGGRRGAALSRTQPTSSGGSAEPNG
jgi:hypothetical protein